MCPRSSWSARNLRQESPQGQASGPSIAAQISDTLRQPVPAADRYRATSRTPLRCAQAATREMGRCMVVGQRHCTSRSACNDIVHIKLGRRQRNKYEMAYQAGPIPSKNNARFRSMQVIVWLHRLKVVLPSRLVVGPARVAINDAAEGRQVEASQVPGRADGLKRRRRLSAHSAGKSVISYTRACRACGVLTGGGEIRRCAPGPFSVERCWVDSGVVHDQLLLLPKAEVRLPCVEWRDWR